GLLRPTHSRARTGHSPTSWSDHPSGENRETAMPAAKTRKRAQALQLIAEGLPYRQVARRLHVSHPTVIGRHRAALADVPVDSVAVARRAAGASFPQEPPIRAEHVADRAIRAREWPSPGLRESRTGNRSAPDPSTLLPPGSLASGLLMVGRSIAA